MNKLTYKSSIARAMCETQEMMNYELRYNIYLLTNDNKQTNARDLLFMFVRFGASPCSGPGTRHLCRRGLGKTNQNRGDVQLQIVIAILIASLRNLTSLFFIY